MNTTFEELKEVVEGTKERNRKIEEAKATKENTTEIQNFMGELGISQL